MTKYHYQAIIPTRPSEQYPSFGVEIIVPASTYAEAKTVEWVEVGRFPEDGVNDAQIGDAFFEAGYLGWNLDPLTPPERFADYRIYRARVSGPEANSLMQDYTKGYTVREYRRILTGEWDSDVIRRHPHWGLLLGEKHAAEDCVEAIIKDLRMGEEPLPLIAPHKSLAELAAEVSR